MAFRHLLVPLDGTALAEQVLPVARWLAQASGARLTLLHVLEEDAPIAKHGQAHLHDAAAAEGYLHRVAATAFPREISVDWHVHEQAVHDVAHSLAAHAEELRPDLVVMCAHGDQWWKERFLGNLGQQLVHDLRGRPRVPVLLAQPGDAGCVSFPFHHILVPLDGEPEHEKGLPVAGDLARQLQAPLTLVRVVPTPHGLRGANSLTATLMPRATDELLRLAEQGASAYLAARITELRDAGLTASGLVTRGTPGEELLRVSAELPADLIVLGTHGLSATQAFWAGSVTPRLLQHARASFLLVS